MLRRPSASDPARAPGGQSRSALSYCLDFPAEPFDSQLHRRSCGCRLEGLRSRMVLCPKVRVQSQNPDRLPADTNGLLSTRRTGPIYPRNTEFEAHA
jgi:hypothetical protein